MRVPLLHMLTNIWCHFNLCSSSKRGMVSYCGLIFISFTLDETDQFFIFLLNILVSFAKCAFCAFFFIGLLLLIVDL